MKRPERPARLLVAAHSHPSISNGGAEISAWRLHAAMRARPGWDSWLVAAARDGSNRPGSHFSQPFDDHEYLFDARTFDWFKFANQDRTFPREFTAVLGNVAPDVLHFHHYIVLGVEAFLHARRALPDCRIVLTLHEFLAICNNHGQMVTREKQVLCHQSSPRDCNRCYPERSPADFFLRKTYIMGFFDLIDHFVAPSHLLARRYIDWGLPEDRISVIENIAAAAQATDAAPAAADPSLLRIAFFGQISELKGIGVMLDAAAILLEEGESAIQFDIHGDYAAQPTQFQIDVLERMKSAGHNVRFHGPYDNKRVDAMMRGVDAVLVPSIWWENSPVVIQEALRSHRPVICSDIGGMAEKVRHGIDGLHFPVGNPAALAALLKALAKDRTRLAAITAGLRVPDPPETNVARHVALYEKLMATPARG